MIKSIFTCFSFLLFVLLLSTVAEFNLNHLDTPQLQTRNFGTAIEGKASNSSLVFLSVNVSNEDECMLKCLMYQDCFSYNFVPRQGELMACEVCRAALLSQLVNKTGYKHRKVLSGCSSNPCSGQDICIPDLQTTSSYRCLKPYMDIELEAYGFGDPPGPSGNVILDSYFKVNDQKYPLAPQSRGHSFRLVTFNGTVNVGPQVTFDSHDDTLAASKMASYINTIPDHSVVLVLVADNGSKYYDSTALMSIGATSSTFGHRSAWTFIGFKGQTKPWIVETMTVQAAGPASVTARIQLTDLVQS